MKKLKHNDDIETALWVWAIGEQLYMLDSFDADYIDLAAERWKGYEYAYQTFLKKYRLTRGKLGKYLRENPKPALRICNKYFYPKLGKGINQAEIMERWHGAVDELARHQNNVAGSPPYSFAMKMFWCYHPEKLTMYDRYVCSALADRYREKITPKNYLKYFYRFFEEEANEKIAEAMSYHARIYPYKYRIADKYLWLKGNEIETRKKGESAEVVTPTALALMRSHAKTKLNL